MRGSSLPAFHRRKATSLTLEVDHLLSQDIQEYEQFYRQLHGGTANSADLVCEMARCFMARDRAFQKFRLQQTRTGARRSARRAMPGVGPEKDAAP